MLIIFLLIVLTCLGNSFQEKHYNEFNIKLIEDDNITEITKEALEEIYRKQKDNSIPHFTIILLYSPFCEFSLLAYQKLLQVQQSLIETFVFHKLDATAKLPEKLPNLSITDVIPELRLLVTFKGPRYRVYRCPFLVSMASIKKFKNTFYFIF